mmetsp:Transcript_30148/g.70434  ORF Transcript_30148/g.70434 Transcript_30148/m.70434 type:complete len:167 (+) Transcript_30148:154-654(+)
MNALVDRFGDKVAILGFPCNQFGHQSNESNDEFLNTLRHVRPGNGFEPKMDLFGKINVNGQGAHPLFVFLRRKLKYPEDDEGVKDTKNQGVADTEYLVSSRGAFDGSTVVPWTPITRTDVAWNFEKFLCDAEGVPVKRYSRYFPTAAIAEDFELLLAGKPLTHPHA